jgi:hypothetical protein
MISGSFPRSQASSVPAYFAKREPARFFSVGGNGIKLYSNLRPNASIRCDQSAYCSCATWIATSNLNCPIGAWISPRCKSPVTAIHSPLPLFATLRGWLADSGTRSTLTQCIESQFCPRNLRITVHFAVIGKAERSRDGRHPQPVHKARLIIRRSSGHSKGNLYAPGSDSHQAEAKLLTQTRPSRLLRGVSAVTNCKSRSIEEAAQCTMACQRPPEELPYGSESETRCAFT